ncbi:SPOR domain-containing protein [Rhodohalobacter sulfatireducens]|uniref:SPOR domain-containing protein n=1 Tax=Rhodohalobacter sulfatireducens TaxID=2911366 RepID=A0ABS9KEB5_9BACT|nr:SPOR domain-containing protein [Rhodohalobacter sulfatireducens]MCG2589197.1 SPOR domain-containing protein [Rhodohalobacter sulfatireducens]
MAKKEYIGLTYEENRLRMARLRTTKNGLELVEVDTVDLPHPITTVSDSGLGDLDFSEDYEEIFEMDDPTSSETVTGFEDLDETEESSREETDTSDLEESFDMTKTEDEADIERENEQLLADYLTQYGKRKVRIGTHIPFGRTTFQVLKNVDPGSMKKNERLEFFREKLQTTPDEEINPDQYSWVQLDDKTCLLAHYADDNSFLNLIELSETYLNKKVLIQERLPDEAIWAGLARVNYTLGTDDITGLIAIGTHSSRIIFMKGEQIVNVIPIITDGEESNDVLNTIFSKILFEIDKGDLPKITRLLLVRSAKLSEKAKRYFDQQFEDVDVDYLTLDSKHLNYTDEILDSPVYLQPYLTSIGAAWAASKIHEKEYSDLSLLPEYIREKQRVLKLEWHGIAILILIALTPLYLNYLYQAKSSQLTDLQQEIQILDNQIEELRPTATMTEDLMSEISILNAENERLLELAQYNQQWSETFRILNEGIADIPNVWLENLSTADNNSLNFNGYSMNRSQIPEFASIFTDANIQQVSQTEMRGATVYSFGMRVNNIRQDIEPFLQEMPEQSFDTEQGSEVEINFSSNELSEDMPAEEIAAPVSESQSSAMSSSSQSPEIEQTEVSEIAESEPMGSGIEPNGDDNEQTDNNPASFKEPPIINSRSQSSFGLMGPENQMLEGAYTIVLHSITDEQRAGREVEILEEEGYKATLWDVVLEDNKRWWRIGVGQFQTVSAALEAVQELPRAYRERNFIIRIREGR